MFAESLQAVAGGARRFDVCLIGSGPAGITLATELGARGWSVLLLEAGGAHVDPDSQAMYEGEVVGPLKFDLEVGRLRCFGGSSNHWGGFCQTLDAIDFEDKVPGIDTKWPIGRSDLDPFLARAESVLELTPHQPDRAYGEALRLTTMRYSPPVNFAAKYRPVLQRMANVTVVLDACVVDLHEAGGVIGSIEAYDREGGRHRLAARQFVLCAGGIENSRILLWANRQHAGRIVKEPAALGRYWIEHPHFTVGEALLEAAAPMVFDRWSIAWSAPTATAMRDRGLLNAGLRLTRRPRETSREMAVRLACVAPELGQRVMAGLNRRLFCGALLRASWEQAPRLSIQPTGRATRRCCSPTGWGAPRRRACCWRRARTPRRARPRASRPSRSPRSRATRTSCARRCSRTCARRTPRSSAGCPRCRRRSRARPTLPSTP
jgi:hypothetical protein